MLLFRLLGGRRRGGGRRGGGGGGRIRRSRTVRIECFQIVVNGFSLRFGIGSREIVGAPKLHRALEDNDMFGNFLGSTTDFVSKASLIISDKTSTGRQGHQSSVARVLLIFSQFVPSELGSLIQDFLMLFKSGLRWQFVKLSFLTKQEAMRL